MIEYYKIPSRMVKMNRRVPVIYEKGVLRLLELLDLPEHTKLTVTVSVPKAGEHAVSAQPRFHQPTRSQPLSQLEPLIGKMPAGGDALKDSEALYDADW
jgi:predicted DNA-binding antitoxin AbrB/MazE fold protein